MRLHLPFSLRKSVLSSLVSMVALSLGSGSACAETESEPQNLVFDGVTLTWNTDTENKVFTNAAGESASFAPGDNVTFASDATASLGEDISAGQINIANGADVVIELADNGLNFDTLSMLGGSLDAGDSLNIAAGETLAVGSNGSVLKSDLVLEKNAGLSVDYAGTGSATSLNNSSLSLQGDTQLQLSGCGNGDGKTYTLLAGISELKDAQGNAISLNSTNNAIAKYFDTSQPGTGFWADATLQLSADGILRLVRHSEAVNAAVTISTRRTGSVDYQYYEGVQFADIEYTPGSSVPFGSAIYGGYDSTIMLSNNGSVSFSGNTASSSSAYGGAIYGASGSTITLSDNGSVSVIGNTASASSYAFGGAIYGYSSTITLSNNGIVSFIGNTASSSYAFGGAIYGDSSSNITLSNNDSVEFSGNTASASSYASGGAIYGASGSTITLSDNGSVSFIGNTASSPSYYAHGGAIYGYSSTITLSNNGSVEFSGNTASGSGGAIDGSTITLSDNGIVSFIGNTASGSSFDGGGAIGGTNIALSDNGSVSFIGNTASGSGGAISGGYGFMITLSNNGSVEFSGNTASGSGGAIDGSTITLSNNGSVEFSGNTASGSSFDGGGAIYVESSEKLILEGNDSIVFEDNNSANSGGALFLYHFEAEAKIVNNGSVLFSRNSAARSGGAIFISNDSPLIIANNDGVIFEKNAEIKAGEYRLRSIYAVGASSVSLSAAAGKSITFRDSIYIGSGNAFKLNDAYEGIAQQGDIIFTGESTVDDLYSTKDNVAGTAEEIQLSRTTEINTLTELYGGRLRVEDGAIYKGRGIIAHEGSEATVRVKDATLNHSGYDLTLYAGTTLELAGRSIIIGTVQMHGDSRLVFDLGESQETTTVYGAMNLEGILSVSARGDYIGDNVILLYVEDGISGWNGNVVSSDGKSYTVMCGDMLVANYNAESFLPYFRGDYEVTNQLSDGCKMNYYKSVQGTGIGESVISGGAVELNYNGSINISKNTSRDSGAAICGVNFTKILLNGNSSVIFSENIASRGGALYGGSYCNISLSNNDSVLFSKNTATAGGAIYGDYDNTISLRDNGSVIFCRNRAELGGAIYRNSGMTELCHNKSVTFIGNTASASSSTPEIIGGAICGQADITLSNNGSVEFIGNTVSGASSVFGGAIGWGGNLNIVDNESVIFEKNSAISSGFSVCGGAIYTYGNLSIRNNDLVEFYQNTEVRDGFYRLRSIYTEGYRPDEIFLSAAAGKSIIFRDSIYIDSYASFKLNEVYKGKSQQGDIIFTGATTMDDLYKVKGDVDGTAAEILASRTSEVHTLTHLYGGKLRVEDGAIYKGRGITAHEGSEATVRVKDATLNHTGYELHFFEGTKLEALGASEIFGDVIVESTATAAFSALTRLEGSLTLAAGAELSLDGELTLNGTLTLGLGLTLSGDILADIKNLAPGQSITLVSGLESLTVQMQTLMRSLEYTTVMTGQELVAADYFSNLQTDSGYVLIYNGATGALTVTQSIPEPTTATLSLLALAALAVRRRRK